MKGNRCSLIILLLLAGLLLASCADLVVRDISYSPADPVTNSQITFSAVVENTGPDPAGPSTLAFQIGGESTPEAFEIPPLSPGESFTVERSVYLNVPQSYRTTVTVDADQDVPESRENNNEGTLSFRVAPGDSYFAGAYYYPWYAHDFHGGAYLREHLVPRQEPVLGEYDDRDTAIIGQHLEWSRYAGIQFWVTSWWGPANTSDTTTRDHILNHPDLDEFKIAVFYETPGRTDDYRDLSVIGPDIAYLAEHYFGHPNYLRIEGKPVLFVYLTRDLSYFGVLEGVVDTMRNTALDAGYPLFIVGDHAFGEPPASTGAIHLLDAITNYDVYGGMGRTGYATQAGVDSYSAAQQGWKDLAHAVGVNFIPSVAPGFNDKAVRSGHEPLSRKLDAGDEFGTLFQAMLVGAKELADPGVGNMLLVTSWNEWHEDTQIEPVADAPATDTDDSPTGTRYTRGLWYEGYDERYLEILHNEITYGCQCRPLP
jgi:glycoprotein endo-alpha-1,2-mannosidase